MTLWASRIKYSKLKNILITCFDNPDDNYSIILSLSSKRTISYDLKTIFNLGNDSTYINILHSFITSFLLISR